MITLNKVKAIIEFYLQTRKNEWGITDEKASLLTNTKKTYYEKIDFLCRLLHKIESSVKKDAECKIELINLRESIAQQEEKELKEHRSSYLGGAAFYTSDYALMAYALKAIRSYITDTILGHLFTDSKAIETLNTDIADLKKALRGEKTKEREEKLDAKKTMLENYNLANYHKSAAEHDFIYIVKYEDHRKNNVFQSINNFDDFYNYYKDTENPFPLLDQLYSEWKNKMSMTPAKPDLAPTLFNILGKAGAPLSKREKILAGQSPAAQDPVVQDVESFPPLTATPKS